MNLPSLYSRKYLIAYATSYTFLIAIFLLS